jgi:hypothetical protein
MNQGIITYKDGKMRVEDEISIIEERIRKEIESQKNGGRLAGYPKSVLQRGRVDVFSACIIEPTGELKRYIHEMLPYMHFTQPKVIVRVSGTHSLVRYAEADEETEAKSFDVLLYSNGTGAWSSSFFIWIFKDGRIAFTNKGKYNLSWDDILKKKLDESSVRSKILETIALQNLEENRSAASTSSSNGGCYIATCVYGSYDCPQVWTLRRYRDYKMSKSLAGRLFLRTYYTFSPSFVKWFGKRKWFVSFWKKHLDKAVSQLKEKGYSDEPYDDYPY